MHAAKFVQRHCKPANDRAELWRFKNEGLFKSWYPEQVGFLIQSMSYDQSDTQTAVSLAADKVTANNLTVRQCGNGHAVHVEMIENALRCLLHVEHTAVKTTQKEQVHRLKHRTCRYQQRKFRMHQSPTYAAKHP